VLFAIAASQFFLGVALAGVALVAMTVSANENSARWRILLVWGAGLIAEGMPAVVIWRTGFWWRRTADTRHVRP